MSDKESEDGREKGEGEEEEEEEEPLKYAPAISALPPKVIQQEESQVEVSASPAFQCLEEVCKSHDFFLHHVFLWMISFSYLLIFLR